MNHPAMKDLEAGLDHICRSPADMGTLDLIVRRPDVGLREVLDVGELDLKEGLKGDNWKVKPSSRTPDGSSHPDMQINIMNSRVVALVAREKSRWPLAGDQLYLDMNLGASNLPPGTRLGLGTAILEVTAQPHTGCKKFVERFGLDAMRFVNAPDRASLHLRGINARVVRSGVIRVGDKAMKLSPADTVD